MEINPAIVISAYNRPHALQRLLDSVAGAVYDTADIPLIISIDQSHDPDVNIVAENFDWKHGTKTIHVHEAHVGLKQHILSCGALAKDYGAIILLEDDLMVSPYFYDYARQAYDFYNQDISIAGISLYNYQVAESCFYPFKAIDDGSDVYFMQVASSWGQLWTGRQWQDFETWFETHPDLSDDDSIPAYLQNWGAHSWKKHFIHYLIATSKYFVFPRISLSTHFEEEGTHASAHGLFQVPLQLAKKIHQFIGLPKSGAVYDAWFEIKPTCLNQLNHTLETFNYEVDLYGTKAMIKNGSDYILSSRQGDQPLISFGDSLFPLESNIALGLEGRDIGLYKKSETRFIPKKLKLHHYLDAFHNEKEYGISVLIPVHEINVTDLKTTVDSVAEQGAHVLECLLVCGPSHYNALKQFAFSNQQKLRIIVCESGDTVVARLACGFASATNGIVTWLLPGNSYFKQAFANVQTIFKSHPLLAWIGGLDHHPEPDVNMKSTELESYRIHAHEVYERLWKCNLNTDTQLQFFRRHTVMGFGGEHENVHDLFFHLVARYQHHVVVSQLGLRSKTTWPQVTDSERKKLLETYAHFKSRRKGLRLNLLHFLLRSPLLSKQSSYLSGIHLHNLPDVIRFDEKHHTFYLNKF